MTPPLGRAQSPRDGRYVTDSPEMAATRESLNTAFSSLDPTPPSVEMEDDAAYRLYRLCPCENCSGTGKTIELGTFASAMDAKTKRCKICRGEGKNLALLATATDPQSVGVAIVTLAEEDEFEGCPMGLMYRPEGKTGKWLIKPFGPSPRNLSDAGKVLRSARTA